MRLPSVTRFVVILATVALIGACQGGASPSTPARSPAASGPVSAAPSGPSSPGAPSASATAGAGASATATATADAGEATELDITARDFSFEGATSVPAGLVRIRLDNAGAEDHQAQIARLNEGVTFEDVQAALQSQDPNALFQLLMFVGGPNAIPPGGEQEVTAVLEPGLHLLLCFIASPDGVPHLAKGMVGQLEVTEGTAGGQIPVGDAELTLQDFAFVGLPTLPAGEQVVRVTNNGPQPHEASVVRLAEGVTVEDVFGMMNASPAPSGPPPFTTAGGIAAISSGDVASVTLDLEPGNYAWICGVPDPASGRPHFQLGMLGPLTVQ